MLVITISMILLAMANLFKPMQSFMKDFMGTYVACLLSSGELPGVRSGTNTLKDADPLCDFSFKGGNAKFSNNAGSGGGSGNSGNNGNSSGGSRNSSGSSSGSGSGAGSNSGKNSSRDGSVRSDDSSGRNSYAGSRSRNSGFGTNSSRRSSDSGSDDDGAGGGKRYLNSLDKNGKDRYFRSQQKVTQLNNNNGRGYALSGMTEEDQRKIERKIQSEPKTVPKSSEEFSVPGKKTTIKPQENIAKKTLEEKEEGFTFGNFMKYLIIAVIILLILVLGGGQAFEMSKSMD